MGIRRGLTLAVLAAVLWPGGAAAAQPTSLALITLDTTRADHLGRYGGPAATPVLDDLAARGVRFARCDTAAPVTLPSHATILTGLLPPRHGVRDNGTFRLAQSFETVAERLRAAGWDTGAVVGAVVLAGQFGLAQGFRRYDDALGGREERPGEEVTDAAGCLLKLGRIREAERSYRAALAVAPALPQAVVNLAHLLRTAGSHPDWAYGWVVHPSRGNPLRSAAAPDAACQDR